jgi:hypothetical protein
VRAVLAAILFVGSSGLQGGSCGWNAGGESDCRPAGPPSPLPEAVSESSGVAWSRVRPEVLWTHNDSDHEATLYAMDTRGKLLGAVPLRDAVNRDWEDMAAGQCAIGHCLYVGDIGDNAEVRDRIVLYRVEDTGSFGATPRGAEAFPMVLPDGPRDMEALFVLPGEELYFITKGRSHPVTVYRYPPPLRAGETVTLEEVQTLTEGPVAIPYQVTGADASPDGRLVAVRTYESLTFYRMSRGRLVPLRGGRVELRTLGEAQGEAVGIGPDGLLALTSEAGFLGRGAVLNILECGILQSPD